MSDKKKLILISGPCAIENKDVCFEVAGHVRAICAEFGIEYIFKSSFKKANRTSLSSFTGINFDDALGILAAVKKEFEVPVLTDIHESHEAADVALVADWLQIPSFLCRQTELLLAAGRTGKGVNIKKGQFAGSDVMQFAVEKVRSTGNSNVMLTERGTTFGYSDLIVDFRNIPLMQRFQVPVILDATHSLQQPNTSAGVTGGKPEFISTICIAAIAAGADGLFIETHPHPSKALSDGANMLPLKELRPLLEKCVAIRNVI